MPLSPQFWLDHIETWKQTGQSQAQYCREQGLKPHQFSYWKCKQNKTSADHKATSGFAVAQFETTTSTHSGLSITLPNGARIEDIHASNAHVAAQLLGALQ